METNKEPAPSDSPSEALSCPTDALPALLGAHDSPDLARMAGLEGVGCASSDELQPRAPSILMREKDRLTTFEIELRRAACATTQGSISADLAHELRGWLNAIVLQVEAIKQGLGYSGEDPALEREIAALERELRRSRQALKNVLEERAPAIHIEEAFGRPS